MRKIEHSHFAYLYMILLIGTCLLLMPFLYSRIQQEIPPEIKSGKFLELLGLGTSGRDGSASEGGNGMGGFGQENDGILSDGQQPGQNLDSDNDGNPDGAAGEGDASDPQGGSATGDGVPGVSADDPGEIREFREVDRNYLADALFIGDSRTVGLFEYADLGGADVFASTGMSVYKVLDSEIEVADVGKTTLEYLLTEKNYGKIYIMLGINELGYVYEETITMYGSILQRIHELQPEAVIFIEGNLHVSKEKSDMDSLYNNANINRLNEGMKAFADSRTFFYIDVNELFDVDGHLGEEYTFDDIHVLAKYYEGWVDWICTKGI